MHVAFDRLTGFQRSDSNSSRPPQTLTAARRRRRRRIPRGLRRRRRGSYWTPDGGRGLGARAPSQTSAATGPSEEEVFARNYVLVEASAPLSQLLLHSLTRVCVRGAGVHASLLPPRRNRRPPDSDERTNSCLPNKLRPPPTHSHST